MWLFASVIGMIIGVGHLMQAFFLGALIYLIARNSKNLFGYIYKKPDDMGETGIENISN